MEKRRFGKTGHMSTLVCFGGAAFWKVTQGEVDATIELALEHGVNHFDVAPTYGEAEVHLGRWMSKHHKDIFLGCKTRARSKAKAWEALKHSLETLNVEYFDLYQLHGVHDLETLNVVLGTEGALEAIMEAKEQGLVRHIGITGHRSFVLIEALKRFDFDSVLFPLNRVLAVHTNDFNLFDLLLRIAQMKDVGTIAVKTLCKRPWEGPMHMYRTWYEPFDDQMNIDRSLWYALSQNITTAAMPSDLRLWPMVLDAAERFRPLSTQEEEEVMAEVEHYKPLFP